MVKAASPSPTQPIEDNALSPVPDIVKKIVKRKPVPNSALSMGYNRACDAVSAVLDHPLMEHLKLQRGRFRAAEVRRSRLNEVRETDQHAADKLASPSYRKTLGKIEAGEYRLMTDALAIIPRLDEAAAKMGILLQDPETDESDVDE